MPVLTIQETTQQKHATEIAISKLLTELSQTGLIISHIAVTKIITPKGKIISVKIL